MSASIATPMAGLPDYDFGPDNIPDFTVTVTDFPDHMELDRSTELRENHNSRNTDPSVAERPNSAHGTSNAVSSEAQKQALGNLLGALIPHQDGQGGENPTMNPAENVSFPAPDRPTVGDQIQIDYQAQYEHSRLPSFDATAAAEIFANEDFSNFDPNMDIPHTPNEQNMYDLEMVHHRQNSNASLVSLPPRPVTPQRREFEAFARLQFEDGNYYLNTYSCELGRDVLAYRAALQKEREEKEAEMNGHGKSRSSSGKASHRSGRIRRQLGSQMQGSVVSEQGGFAGIDEAPMRPPPNPDKPTMSSQESESSVVKPAEYLINPRTLPSFDYHRSTEMQAKWTAQEENQGEAPDNEQPVAVTAAHLPNPHMCPLIPIHGKPKDGQTDAELHKKISRRHVKIRWSFEFDRWEMLVQGRNGAYCDHKFVRWKGVVPLYDGSLIQIAHIVLTFRLPNTGLKQQETEHTPRDIDADEAIPSVEHRSSESVAVSEKREPVAEVKPAPKISLKISQKVEATPSEPQLGPDGLIKPKRGPGRPPKDGIMSTRERREREKAAKAAAMREANGGKTPPPPAMRSKVAKPTPPAAEEPKVEAKPEKRKYTKRKATDENGNTIFDADDEVEEGVAASDGESKTKKARAQRERSESPEYPPKESLTAEQLARPAEPYSQLLYKILLELYPRALPLKDIYRELKKRYPWYVYEAQTDGWQSSVRHNLNSEFGKYFAKGNKEGKGFAWQAIPDAQVPQTEKKRTTQAAPQRPRPQQQQRPQFQPLPGQNIQWQGTGTGAFPANGTQQPFVNHGPWPQQGQLNGTPVGNGNQQLISQAGSSVPQMRPPSQTPQPGPAQTQGTLQAGQAQAAPTSTSTNSPNIVPSFSSAASNMPCTLDGIEAIKRFEVEMYRQLQCEDGSTQEKRDYWVSIFASAKKRILHGHPTSTRPEGDSKAESIIMNHMTSFITKFANPNFKGFTTKASQQNPQPDPQPNSQSDRQSDSQLNAQPNIQASSQLNSQPNVQEGTISEQPATVTSEQSTAAPLYDAYK